MAGVFNCAILVLGRKLLPNGNPSKILIGRMKAAIAIFNKMNYEGKVCAMICSGGEVMENTRPEAIVMKELALADGVASEHIFLEEQAYNTPENMIYSRRILDSLGVKDVVLVTSDFHMKRAEKYAEAFIPKTEGFTITLEEDHPPLNRAIRQEIEKEKKSITYVSSRVNKYNELLRFKKI